MRATVQTCSRKVHAGELPFDRTIKVSLTERLTKEQIQARMPHNLRTLEHLLEAIERDLTRLIQVDSDRRSALPRPRAFIRRRRKCLHAGRGA
jgi:RNA polymerase primary sigma factor